MENSPAEYVDGNGELVHELPREEALVRLYELTERYAGGSGIPCPIQRWNSASEPVEPHRFAFGCCRDAAARGGSREAGFAS